MGFYYIVPATQTGGGITAQIPKAVSWIGQLSDDGQSYFIKTIKPIAGLTPIPVGAFIEYPSWKVGINYNVEDIVNYDNTLYEVIQAHMSHADRLPPEVPTLYKITSPPGVVAEWRQPLDTHDAYEKGAVVHHNGVYWKSVIDANVWEPGVYGWERIPDIADVCAERGLIVESVLEKWKIRGQK